MDHNDLDVDMAQLEINEKKRSFNGVFKYKTTDDDSPQSSPESEETITQPPPRRSTRKKVQAQETEKRRVLIKPKKHLNGSSSTNEINNYYLDKRVKRLPPFLETIFEEPQGNTVMSTRRFKRCIQFSNQIAPSMNRLKVRKRAMKAQKLSVIKRLNKNIALELLKKKLSTIEEDEINS